MFLRTFILCYLASWPTILGSRFPVIPGIPLLEDTSINHIQPLLYFPFANFLANPCGFVSTPSMMNMILTNQSTVPLNQESIITNEDSTNRPELPQQALEFLAPFRELYSDNNYTTAEKAILIHELTMTLQEAKHRTRYIYSNSVMQQCEGLQLDSLPRINRLGSVVQMDEIYRGIMTLSAHLHLMIHDFHDESTSCCTAIRNPAHYQNLRMLSGKIETIMCLLLGISENNSNDHTLLQVAQQVLQTRLDRCYECSNREIRGCIVVRYTYRILSAVLQLLHNRQKQNMMIANMIINRNRPVEHTSTTARPPIIILRPFPG